jgi:uncharacterized membrane protein (DUF485 family)
MNHNARWGAKLFVLYSVLYLGFMLLNTFFPSSMELTPVAGVNLAILYGFGLIIAAFVLALFYGIVCNSDEGSPDDGPRKDGRR